MLSGAAVGYGWASSNKAWMIVAAKGVSFVLMHFPHGVKIRDGGSLTMSKCTSTGDRNGLYDAGRLTMEDCRIFGSGNQRSGISDRGVLCDGQLEATRCIFEGCDNTGVYVRGAVGTTVCGLGNFIECVMRNNAQDGLQTYNNATVNLMGGTFSGNARHGVNADEGGKVHVAAASTTLASSLPCETVDRPQAVSRDNKRHGWHAVGEGSEIIGIPQEKINV